ncbi:MAG: endonuclease/exonuclease/phosphatase family protein [Planctomycetes bacterium]|nr:endonuclease/exonuclease/phosphatase family protein [Planctomycetota bacterium]
MKVISYNIHKGFSFGNTKFVLKRMREHLRDVNPDLVFLQEVLGAHDGHASRVDGWPKASQFEYIADTLWPHHAYGKNAVYDEGHHGNAILSKHDIVMWENIDVSNNRLERRGMLHAVIHTDDFNRDLHVICLHLDLFEGGRERQVARLAKRIEEAVPHDAPLIVAGDFNDWKERAGRILEDELDLIEIHKAVHGYHARSFPSWWPFLPLDRMYCRGLEPVEAKCLSGKPWSELSDHAALFAELRFEPSTKRHRRRRQAPTPA